MWIGTLNNPQTHYPDVSTEEYLNQWHTQTTAQFVTGQLEKGEAGTPHIQFYLHFSNNQRVSALKKHCKHAAFFIVK